MEPPRRPDTIRLEGWDYRSAGPYFVTMAAWGRQPLFGLLREGAVALSEAGRIATRCWNELPEHFPQVILDEWVVMPDHFHAIAWIGTDSINDPSTLATIVGSFKSASTRVIRLETRIPDLRVWQRGYHDRIVRNADELDRIRRYIRNNPRSGIDHTNPLPQPPLTLRLPSSR